MRRHKIVAELTVIATVSMLFGAAWWLVVGTWIGWDGWSSQITAMVISFAIGWRLSRLFEKRDAERAEHHVHDWKAVSVTGTGWTLYRCACGQETI